MVFIPVKVPMIVCMNVYEPSEKTGDKNMNSMCCKRRGNEESIVIKFQSVSKLTKTAVLAISLISLAVQVHYVERDI